MAVNEFLFQIVTFFAGALIGISIPLLPRDGQKKAAGMLAVLLVAISLFQAGDSVGYNRAKSEFLPTVVALTDPTPHPFQASILGTWEFERLSSGEDPGRSGGIYKRISFNNNGRYTASYGWTSPAGKYEILSNNNDNTLLLEPTDGTQEFKEIPTQFVITFVAKNEIHLRSTQQEYEAVYRLVQ